MSAVEELSTPYRLTIDCILNADEDPVDPSQLIGKAVGVTVDTASDTERHFHGIATELRLLGWRNGHLAYRIVARPWSWLLTQRSDARIFQEMKVDAILKKVFDDAGFSDYELSLEKSYPTLEYCVQYEETDHDFFNRMCEKFGLFYYFKMEGSKHTLMILDSANSGPEVSDYKPLRYRPDTESGEAMDEDVLIHWGAEDRLRTAKAEISGFNYESAANAMNEIGTSSNLPEHSAHGKLQTYLTRMGFDEKADGKLLADISTEIGRADARRVFCQGRAPLLSPGSLFKLSEFPVQDENTDHYVVRAEHEVSVNLIASGYGAEDAYHGIYEVSRKDDAYKAPRTTPLPRIYGPQTGWVIAESSASEEIDVDDSGRILVKFHWNRQKKDDPGGGKDKQCSCRVRVAQLWAGSKWGGVWIPRVGMEVVVEFIDGDPDRPLVTGCVYNSVNKPPVNFPADKTVSTIMSRSSKSGGADNYNELRFDDKKGSELVYVQAEKDMERLVKNNDDLEVQNNQTIKIKQNRTEEITSGNETINIKQGKRTTTIQGNDVLTLKQGSLNTAVKMGNIKTDVKMGNETTKISLGKQQTQAMQSIEFKVGGSSIKIDMMGVTIKAPMIKIEASAMLQAKGGAMAKVEGGGMLMLKGGITMIN